MIRMSRIGKKKKPMYRLTIAERSKDPYGKALEILGSYNPFTKKLEAKGERINYWISMGAGMTPSVNNLLIDNKIIKGEKVKASKKGKKAEDAAKEAPKEEKSEEQPKEEKSEEKPKEEKPISEEAK